MTSNSTGEAKPLLPRSQGIFGISDAAIRRRLAKGDIEDDPKPITTARESDKLLEGIKRIRLPEKENEVLGRAVVGLERGINPMQ